MNIMEMLQSVLAGQPQPAGPSGPPPPSTNTQPRQAPPTIPPRVPLPQPRPEQRPMQAPQGSLAPQRAEPAPMQVPPMQPQRTAPAPMPAPQPQGGPMAGLQRILSGGGAGGDWRQMVRAAGAGMAKADPRAPDDPFAAFGAGFGGAQGYYGDQEEIAREQEQLEYERQRQALLDEQGMSESAARMELAQATEARAAKRDELLNRKTAREIEQMSKQTGIDVGELLEIERIAQAAGENIIDPAERRSVVESERQRLMQQVAAQSGGGRTGGGDLSSRPGVSGQTQRARNPETGEVLEYRPGQGWVPVT